VPSRSEEKALSVTSNRIGSSASLGSFFISDFHYIVIGKYIRYGLGLIVGQSDSYFGSWIPRLVYFSNLSFSATAKNHYGIANFEWCALNAAKRLVQKNSEKDGSYQCTAGVSCGNRSEYRNPNDAANIIKP